MELLIFRVDCSRFVDLYGTVGSVFPCYYSSLQPNLVITYLDFDEVSLFHITGYYFSLTFYMI